MELASAFTFTVLLERKALDLLETMSVSGGLALEGPPPFLSMLVSNEQLCSCIVYSMVKHVSKVGCLVAWNIGIWRAVSVWFLQEGKLISFLLVCLSKRIKGVRGGSSMIGLSGSGMRPWHCVPPLLCLRAIRASIIVIGIYSNTS